jgi:alkaline phosphatase
MKMRAGAFFAVVCCPTLAFGDAPATSGLPAKPNLIVAISVDQFSADLFAEYRPLFSQGLKRLQTGAVFPSGYQSHAATETCPGHSTILTGSHPARTGIIANDWYDLSLARADKRVYCTEDPTVAGSSSQNYTVSPYYLKALTLGDRAKAANPQTRVVSVAGKDRAAIMMGGHSIDEAWYWGGKAFVTLTGRTQAPPQAVDRINTQLTATMAKKFIPMLPDICRAKAAPVAVGERSVGGLHDREIGDYTALRASLEFDTAVTDLAIGLIKELKLGQGTAPDILSIGLSATDYVGHAFGTEGAETCAQVLSVDLNVGRILKALDDSHQPYAIVLTADHGGHDLPERNQMRGMEDAVRVDPALSPNVMSKQIAADLGMSGNTLYGTSPFGDIYVAKDLSADVKAKVIAAARARYQAHAQVAAVFTAEELRQTKMPTTPVDEWTLAERFAVNFDPTRSGDLLVALKPHVTPISEPKAAVATHGSPWNYDRRVPILFFQPGRPGFEQPLPVETVDILPTLAALIGLKIQASEIDGRCLNLSQSSQSTCK